MIKSLFSGVTGLKTHNQRMDVIGNNIANVNTTAYKAGTVTFKDVYYQTRQRASGGSFTEGGVNPMQIGYGVQLGTIGKVMTQSGLTYSDSVFDCALEGGGFFQVMDPMGNIFYTRLGRFGLDDFGNLVDPNGNVVLGVSGDPTGVAAARQRINIFIPDIQDQAAQAITQFEGHDIMLTAGQIGPNGNIALTIIPSDTPFATMSGSSLNVYMDLSKDYEAIARFGIHANGDVGSEDNPVPVPAPFGAITGVPNPGTPDYNQRVLTRISELFTADLHEAIRIGGVNVDPAILSLNPDGSVGSGVGISFGSVPAVTAALNATNHVQVNDSQRISFEMVRPGAAGNNYEINVRTHNASNVIAQWQNNVLTITLPAGGASEADIQLAVTNAARGNENLLMNIELQWLDGSPVTPVTTWGNPVTVNLAGGSSLTFNIPQNVVSPDPDNGIEGHSFVSTPVRITNYNADGTPFTGAAPVPSWDSTGALVIRATPAFVFDAAAITALQTAINGLPADSRPASVTVPVAVTITPTNGPGAVVPRAPYTLLPGYNNTIGTNAPIRLTEDANAITASAATLAALPAAANGTGWVGTVAAGWTFHYNGQPVAGLTLPGTDANSAATTLALAKTEAGLTASALLPATSNPLSAFQPGPIPPSAMENIEEYFNGRTLRVGMGGGADSFFQTAFRNLSTLRLTGGAFHTPQDPSTTDIFIAPDGTIYGTHAVHGLLMLGRIDIVEFINPEGLQQVGTSYFTETLSSGPPMVRIASTESDTKIVSGALEMSNVDLSQEFSDMIITQRGFQANSRIITVSDSMLEELVNLKR
jgi:flagellar hook protein FlgE